MTVRPEDFRAAGGRFASGVTVVTAAHAGKVYGITASAFSSVSLDPPQVLVCVARTSKLHEMVVEGKTFAVSILANDQRELSELFAKPDREPVESFVELDVPHVLHATGTPVLRGCVAFFDCTLARAYDGGDHSIFVGDVRAAGLGAERPPLLYFNRGYRGITDL